MRDILPGDSQVYISQMIPIWFPVITSYSIHYTKLYEQHPTKDGSYVIASTFYSAIFKTSPLNAYNKTIDSKNAEIIQNTAYDYVIKNLDVYKLKQNTLKVKYERTANGEYLVHCDANYPNACSSYNFV